jgi:hypothetical protein
VIGSPFDAGAFQSRTTFAATLLVVGISGYEGTVAQSIETG